VFKPEEKISINKTYSPKTKTILTDVRPKRPRPTISEITNQIDEGVQRYRKDVIQAQIVKEMKASGQNG